MTHYNLIGQNVVKFRGHFKWSQQDLATQLQLDGLSISRESIANIEARRQSVSDTQIFHLARVLKVSEAEFFHHPQLAKRQ